MGRELWTHRYTLYRTALLRSTLPYSTVPYCSLLHSTLPYTTLLYHTALLCTLCLMPIYLVCYTIAGPPVKYIFRNSAIAPHDFSFTDNYYVFVENRAEGDTLPYLLGNCTTLRLLRSTILRYIILDHTAHTALHCPTLHYNTSPCTIPDNTLRRVNSLYSVWRWAPISSMPFIHSFINWHIRVQSQMQLRQLSY